MNYKIAIEAKEKQALLAHLEAAFPNEGCGFFFGKDEDELRIVTKIRPVNNAKAGDQRRRFEINPLDYIKAERYALQHNLTLLGIYHSPPNHPAIPSEHDRRQAVPFFSYIIASIQDGQAADLTSWRLNEETHQFDKEQVI